MLTIDLPQGRFPVVLFANRFGIEYVEGEKVVHFGLEASQSRLLSSWQCVFESRLVEDQKENWLNYLASTGYPETPADLKWRPSSGSPSLTPQTPLVNLVMWSRAEGIAEIRCYSFSIGDTLLPKGEKPPDRIAGQALALIRCSLDLQKQLLEAPYREFPI